MEKQELDKWAKMLAAMSTDYLCGGIDKKTYESNLNLTFKTLAESGVLDIVSNNIQPIKIDALLKEKYSHKALKDEFGVNGQYDLSTKDILDIIIDLSNCC